MSTMRNLIFAQRLRERMEAKNLTQKKLADLTGISQATLSRYMRGGNPSAGNLLKLSRTLDVDPWTLLGAPSAQLQALYDELTTVQPMTWSISKVNDYLRCPALFYFRHIQREPEPVSPKAVVGSATHAGIEQYLKAKAGLDASDPVATVKKRIEEAAPKLIPDEETGEMPDPAKLAEKSLAMLKAFKEKILPDIKPVAIEQRMETIVAGARFTCVLDACDADGVLHDFKTADRKPSENDIHESLQGTIYSKAFREHFGRPETKIVFQYLIERKKGGVDVVPIQTERTEADYVWLESVVKGVIEGVKRGHFYPNPNNKFGCAKCPFRQQCYQMFGRVKTEAESEEKVAVIA